jgi:imidazolonepropionase-like amidohydrolase
MFALLAATLVIQGGTLIDGNGGPPVRDAVVVIEGNTIRSVERRGQASYPAAAQVLRADGKFIVPGLMDAHVHYGEWLPELFLAHGVTSIFEVGGGGEWGLAQRQGVARGKIRGPRIFLAVGSLAGGRIAAQGGVTAAEGMLRSRFVVDTAAKAREVVRRYLEAGADMIKVHRGPPQEVYQAAVEEAHKAGRPVVAQPLGPTVYAREAVLAGVDVIEHAAGIGNQVARDPSRWQGWGEMEEHSLDPSPFADVDDTKAAEMIRLLVARHVALEPDLIAQGHGLRKVRDRYEAQDDRLLLDPGLAYLPERNRAKWLGNFTEFVDEDPAVVELREKGFANMCRFIGAFARAGGAVLSGTDSSTGSGWATPGIGLHHELDLLVDAGLTPMQAILASTRNVARAFRVDDRLGTLEPGKLADLLVVDDDPLKDVKNLLKIAWVVQDGRVVDRTFHPWFRNPLPENSVEGATWVAALKKEMESMRTPAFGQPPPGIESVSPTTVTEGDPPVTVTVKGVGFTKRSVVYFDGRPVPFTRVSGTELKLEIGAPLIARAGTFPITVVNPQPLQRPQWGGTSNRAYLMVDFKY